MCTLSPCMFCCVSFEYDTHMPIKMPIQGTNMTKTNIHKNIHCTMTEAYRHVFEGLFKQAAFSNLYLLTKDHSVKSEVVGALFKKTSNERNHA